MKVTFYSLLLLLVTGCSNNYLASSKNRTMQHLALEKMTHWKIKGRISIKTPEQSFIARILWRQNKSHFTIRIYGDIGQTYATLDSDNSNLTVLQVNGKSYQGSNAQQLMNKVLGWQLPVTKLSTWMKGQETQQTQSTHFFKNEDHSLASIDYDKWQIKYLRYKAYNKIRLPNKITITHPDVGIKLSIHQWIFE